MLQVREAILTSALLRLPQKIPLSEKRRRVDMILEELVSRFGLWSCGLVGRLPPPVSFATGTAG